MRVGEATIEIVRSSVTDQQVDVIVNAANKGMRGGGGIDGRIHRAAGKGLKEELEGVAPNGAETGEPVVTGAHNLPQKKIIHVAGPRWRDGNHGEPDKLAASYYNSLEAADKLGLKSIAFCSIATGVYGFPITQAAPLAIDAAVRYLKEHPGTNLRRVVFSLWGEAEFEEFRKTYDSRR